MEWSAPLDRRGIEITNVDFVSGGKAVDVVVGFEIIDVDVGKGKGFLGRQTPVGLLFEIPDGLPKLLRSALVAAG